MGSASPRNPGVDRTELHRRACELLERATPGGCRGNVLIIGHDALPMPDCPGLQRDEHHFGLALRIHTGTSPATVPACTEAGLVAGRAVACSSGNLPFQEEIFHHVILYHAARDGTEPELPEACRVLRGDGELWILGLNRASWSGLAALRNPPVPLLRLARLRGQLHFHEMDIHSVLASGLLGRDGPQLEQHGMTRLALPFADLLLVKARHRQRFSPTRLRLKGFSAGAVPTSLLVAGP